MLCALMAVSAEEAMYMTGGSHHGGTTNGCLVSDRVSDIQSSTLPCVVVCSIGLHSFCALLCLSL